MKGVKDFSPDMTF